MHVILIALLSTTLLALASVALLLHLTKQWWPGNTTQHVQRRRAANAVALACLILSLWVHPVINRALFGGLAEGKLARIQASLGHPIDELLQAEGPAAQADASQAPAFGVVHRFDLAPWYLLWPKHSLVDVLALDGKVIQVGTTHHLPIDLPKGAVMQDAPPPAKEAASTIPTAAHEAAPKTNGS